MYAIIIPTCNFALQNDNVLLRDKYTQNVHHVWVINQIAVIHFQYAHVNVSQVAHAQRVL